MLHCFISCTTSHCSQSPHPSCTRVKLHTVFCCSRWCIDQYSTAWLMPTVYGPHFIKATAMYRPQEYFGTALKRVVQGLQLTSPLPLLKKKTVHAEQNVMKWKQSLRMLLRSQRKVTVHEPSPPDRVVTTTSPSPPTGPARHNIFCDDWYSANARHS